MKRLFKSLLVLAVVATGIHATQGFAKPKSDGSGVPMQTLKCKSFVCDKIRN
jgi:hypothetical protein